LLLLLLQRDARPLFEMLVDKYRPALIERRRGPAGGEEAGGGGLMPLVQAVGARFFNIAPPRPAGMSPMLEQMMGMLSGGSGLGAAPRGVGKALR